jgi:hypothetical protein
LQESESRLPQRIVPNIIAVSKPFMMAHMNSERLVYILSHCHESFSKPPYGCEYGFGERTLNSKMVSGQQNLNIKPLVLCRYEDNLYALIVMIDKDKRILLRNVGRRKSYFSMSPLTVFVLQSRACTCSPRRRHSTR